MTVSWRSCIVASIISISWTVADAAVPKRQVHMSFANAAWTRAIEAPGEKTALAEESFGAAQDATNSQTSAALAQMGARFAAGTDKLAAMARRRQDTEARLKAEDQQLLRAFGEGKPDQARLIRSRIDSLTEELGRIEAEMRRDFPEYSSLVSPAALGSGEAARLLRPNEAILFVIPDERGTHVFGLSDRGLRWHRADLNSTRIGAAVAVLRCGASRSCADYTGPFNRKIAHSLYKTLVEPVSDVFEGKDEIFVVTSGPLGSLPFALLVTQPPTGADRDEGEIRRTSWLIDRYALTYLPSVSSLKALRTFQQRTRSGNGFIGFGDPVLPSREPIVTGENQEARTRGAAERVYAGASSTGTGAPLADPAAVRSNFDALPGTRREIAAMKKALGRSGSSVYLGAKATEANVKSSDFSQASVVVFATHGILAGEFAGFSEPGLIFTPPASASAEDDGILSASEAAQLRLSADWVILSACNTAGADGTLGSEGLSGLARAFFYAGARALLVSHWPIVDDVAATLSVDVIRRQRAEPAMSRAKALQQAMLAVRNAGRPGWSHPRAWAPFVLVGETFETDRKAARAVSEPDRVTKS